MSKFIIKITNKLHSYFWNIEYPSRSFTRVLVLLGTVIYIGTRFFFSTNQYVIYFIDSIVEQANLGFIQSIKFNASQHSPLWEGNGTALQLQLLITWPLVLIFAAISAWLNRNGSKEFEKYPPIIKSPSLKNMLKNFLVVFMILLMAYFPFSGTISDKKTHSSNLFTISYSDTYTTSIFWIFYGWIVINLSMIAFYVIKVELRDLLNTGDKNGN